MPEAQCNGALGASDSSPRFLDEAKNAERPSAGVPRSAETKEKEKQMSVMKRWSILGAVVATAIGLAVCAGTASASTSGAHFTSTSTSVNSAGSLVATFSEAGLGNENVHYSLSADSSATYACINGGGNHPKAAN